MTAETSSKWPLVGSSSALQALVRTMQCIKNPAPARDSQGMSILSRENGAVNLPERERERGVHAYEGQRPALAADPQALSILLLRKGLDLSNCPEWPLSKSGGSSCLCCPCAEIKAVQRPHHYVQFLMCMDSEDSNTDLVACIVSTGGGAAPNSISKNQK